MKRRLSAAWGRLGTVASVAVVTVAVLVVGAAVAGGWHLYESVGRTSVTAEFPTASGIYEGDDVYVLGIKVGAIDTIVPQGDKVKITFHYDSSVKVPADAKAVILSPSLVSSRAIQLTPAYGSGPTMVDGARIGLDRTAVPVEWDDFRAQLERLASSLAPTTSEPSGPLGGFIDSAANNLDGRGQQINDTVSKLSDAMTTLSDGRDDLFAVIRDLQVFVDALASSDQQIVQFNGRLASVTQVLTNTDNELSGALSDIDNVTDEITTFVADNRDKLSHAVERLTEVTTTLNNSKPALEQLLHVAPNAFANALNIYQPAQGALTGALAVTQFQNPVQFICGAIQAASQKGAEESAKLCVQYLAPVLKSIQFNYPPFGVNPVEGVQARKEQVDYSEPFLNPNIGAPVTRSRTVDPRAGLPGLLGGN
ncbi:mammalian cell entry protein [Williamsia sp. 1138]|uniref:MCE family protein n=1 Tax=Williamsia sp. 1138 TaxID=1903117 RepID=UPI000A11B44A|nr:MCE family protein [Williamsia sp. 1138]OZG28873.1 mammalian cell entry protein [Williamsia sp. 1138]